MREQLHKILRLRSRISTQIYVGIGGAVLLTVAASLVGWFSFNRVDEAVSHVNEGSVPELTASFGVAQFSGNLVAAGPRLISAATEEEFQLVAVSIDQDQASFEETLATLQQQGTEAERFQRIRSHADTLTSNIKAIKDEMSRYFWLAEGRDLIREELVTLRDDLENQLIPAIDDQLFYTVTGYRVLGAAPAATEEHFHRGGILQLPHSFGIAFRRQHRHGIARQRLHRVGPLPAGTPAGAIRSRGQPHTAEPGSD